MNAIKLEKKLGEGSFGIVYRIVLDNMKFALKIEKKPGSLKNEINLLKKLNHPSIPKLIDCGYYNRYAYLIIPLYKISLTQITNKNPEFFNNVSVAAIGWNMIEILEYMNRIGILYLDIKPENIMIGFDNKIYLVDFGLYGILNTKDPEIASNRNSIEDVAVMLKTFNNVVGTANYSSINAHKNIILTEKDSLESLAYTLIFLLKKELPWTNTIDMEGKKKKKETTSVKELCKNLKNKDGWIKFVEYIKFNDFKSIEHYRSAKKILLNLINYESTSKGCCLFGNNAH